MEMNGNRGAYAFAGLSVLLWSTVGAAFKVTLRHTTPLDMLFWSSLTATAILFLYLLASGRLWDSLAGWKASVVMGFINPFLYYTVLFTAYDMLPAQEAQPLNYTWPIVLSILSALVLRRKMKLRSLAGIFVSFFGVFVISTRGNILGFHFSSPLGAGLAMGSAVFWAVFWILNMKDSRTAEVKMFFNFLFGCLFSLAALLIYGGLAMPSTMAMAGSIYIGLFEMGITFVIWMKALGMAEDTAKVSNLIYLSPFLGLVFIHFVAGEEILPSTVAGLVFIVAGILVQGKGQVS